MSAFGASQAEHEHSLNFPRIGTKLWRCLHTFITSVRMRFGSCSRQQQQQERNAKSGGVGAQQEEETSIQQVVGVVELAVYCTQQWLLLAFEA